VERRRVGWETGSEGVEMGGDVEDVGGSVDAGEDGIVSGRMTEVYVERRLECFAPRGVRRAETGVCS
jgi:hypothetical protein